MTKSVEELVLILDTRISKLKQELKNDFVDSKNDIFFNQYNNLKRSVGDWISQLSTQ